MNLVTYTNGAHIKMCENMLLSASSFLTKNDPYIYCMDDESYSYFLQNGWKNTRQCSFVPCKSEALDWSSQDYRVLIRNKFFAIQQVLEETDEPILFCDSDIFFFKNPTQYLKDIHKEHNVNIITQSDPPHTPICTGFICLYPTEEVYQAIDFVNTQSHNYSRTFDDQLDFIQVVYEKKIPYFALDQQLFPNGSTFFLQNEECPNKFIIHANYMIGHDTKVKALKEANAWIV